MLKSICDDIYNLFISGTAAYNRELFHKVNEISSYFQENIMTPSALEILFELERKLMNSKGPHKQFIEKHIFLTILMRTSDFSDTYKKDEYLLLNKNLAKKETNNYKKQKHLIALKLVSFANEIFNFKKERDNFSNKRKSLSLEILSHLSNHYDIPDAIELCLLSLKSKKKDLILAAIEFQNEFSRHRKIPVSIEIINLLDKIILQTKDRSVATSALDLQIKANHISEFEALSRIDDWKEKNDCW